jgi:DNA-binding NtrC family response regulator
MVKKRTFREDLLHRIQSITIRIPSLREHPEDIEDIAEYYIEELCKKFKYTTKKKATKAFMKCLMTYKWPGNVRELKNVLETVLTYASHDDILHLRHLPANIKINGIVSQFTGKEIPNEQIENMINSTTALTHFDIESGISDNHDRTTISITENLNKPINTLQPEFLSENESSNTGTINVGLVKSFHYIDEIPKWKDMKKIFEKKYLEQIMKATSNNFKESAEIGGFSESRFYGILKQHKISTKPN